MRSKKSKWHQSKNLSWKASSGREFKRYLKNVESKIWTLQNILRHLNSAALKTNKDREAQVEETETDSIQDLFDKAAGDLGEAEQKLIEALATLTGTRWYDWKRHGSFKPAKGMLPVKRKFKKK